MLNYKEICDRVCLVARSAGEYIAAERKRFTLDDVEFKDDSSNLVSYVDKCAEKMIVAELSLILPQAGFITEEGTAQEYSGQKYKWVIDPLDGTTNFVHGQPPYCTSIALMCDNEVVVGVIYEPSLDEMYCAWQGSDAYMNGEKIRVSKVDKVAQSLIAIGFSYNLTHGDVEAQIRTIAKYQLCSNGIRRLGSAAMDLAYLACGRYDIFVHQGLNAWDVAAGALIVQRAGGLITDYSGGDNYIFGRELIASNPLLYDEFITIL